MWLGPVCLLGAQYTLAVTVNTGAVSVSMKGKPAFVNPQPQESRVSKEHSETPPYLIRYGSLLLVSVICWVYIVRSLFHQ